MQKRHFHKCQGNVQKQISLKDREPEFAQGQDSLQSYLKHEVRYPKLALKYQVEGRVLTEFTVTKKGKIRNINIVKGIFDDCDDEAIFVVKNMPDWKPGIRNGKPVDMKVYLPVEFKISKK